MVLTRRRSRLIDETSSSSSSSSSSSIAVAPPKKLKVSTSRGSRMKTLTNTRLVKPPKKKLKASTLSTTPSEIPKSLYDLLQKIAKFRESLKQNPNNRHAKTKLEYHEPLIHCSVAYHLSIHELPRNWEYDPEASYVPKPPAPPKPKTEKKKKKKKIKITWSSYNYHGPYQLNYYEKKVWNSFIMKDKACANKYVMYPVKEHLHTVDDVRVVDLLGKFAVNTFNKSCKMYVNKDEDSQVSGAEFMECKFYKLTWKHIFYMTIEAIEQGIPGVYETRVECVPENGGAMTLLNFVLTDHEPEWKRPWVKPRLESEFEYETVEDGSSDPEDFYKLTGMVHRLTVSGGFDYHNPAYSPHMLNYCRHKDKKALSFEVNVSEP